MYLRDIGQEETNQSATRPLKMFVCSLAVMDFDNLWLENFAYVLCYKSAEGIFYL